MQNDSNSDRLSSAFLRLLDALLLRNPERTAIGAMLGLTVYGIFNLIAPVLRERGINLGQVEWWVGMAGGIAFLHLPFILWSVRKRPLISDELENLIALVETTNIGEVEKRSAYRRVVNRCIEEFSITGSPKGIKEIVQESVELEKVKESN